MTHPVVLTGHSSVLCVASFTALINLPQFASEGEEGDLQKPKESLKSAMEHSKHNAFQFCLVLFFKGGKTKRSTPES